MRISDWSSDVCSSDLCNLPPLPGIFPDYSAPIVRRGPEGRELAMARWGMPSPSFVLTNKRTDAGVTNVRNTSSPHWRRWLGVESRCVVPFTSFRSEEHTSELQSLMRISSAVFCLQKTK